MKAAITPALVAAALALSACGGSEEATPVDNGVAGSELNTADVTLPEENFSDATATDLNAAEPLPIGNETELNTADTSANAL